MGTGRPSLLSPDDSAQRSRRRGEVAYCVEGPDDRHALPPAHNLFTELADALRREIGRLAAALHATRAGLPTAIVPR